MKTTTRMMLEIVYKRSGRIVRILVKELKQIKGDLLYVPDTPDYNPLEHLPGLVIMRDVERYTVTPLECNGWDPVQEIEGLSR